jgi:alcohol dehydrogenase class IV
MMSFEFATATEIVFGRGRVRELGLRAGTLGKRALLVTGAHPERLSTVLAKSGAGKLVVASLAVSGEPTTELVCRGVALARECSVDLVLGIGGGSALDAAKAIAALVANGGDPLDYLEVVGRGRALLAPSLPCCLVPTTAGTGSEVTKNAVLAVESQRVKVSLRSPYMLPRLALVDSELCHGVPPDVTAATGLDALTQVLEPYVSNARAPLTDALCVEGLRRGARSLARAVEDGSDAGAREDLAVTSLFGGLCLANAKLGAVHGLAGPLGGALSAPHGALCARLLPTVMQQNLDKARTLGLGDIVERYGEIARIFTGDSRALPEAGVDWVGNLVEELAIPRLRTYGLEYGAFAELVLRAQAASSMKGNPVTLAAEEITKILELSW